MLQAKIARASLTEPEAEAFELDETDPPEADPKTEFEFQQEFELNKLQVQQEGRQLGYLLVMKTKGETQLQIRRWIQLTVAAALVFSTIFSRNISTTHTCKANQA